jgi:uncharacterized protein (TIGR03067 family)
MLRDRKRTLRAPAGADGAAIPGPLDELQGAWRVAGLRMAGFALPAAFFSAATVEIRGARFSATGMGSEYSGLMEVSGGRLKMAFDSGPEKGNAIHGLLAWDGAQLRLCLARRGAPQPAGPEDPSINLDLRLERR